MINSSSQKLKKSELGKQSSSKIIPLSTCLKNQSIPLETAIPHPKFVSLNNVLTSQFQSIFLSIHSRISITIFSSSCLSILAPSLATNSFFGLISRICSKTIFVVSKRLNVNNNIGVLIDFFNHFYK